MADTNVQLPPNSTGQQIRVETGDSSNFIPTGVAEETVILTDALGLFPGDGRMAPLLVTETTMRELVLELKRQTLLLSLAFNIAVPSATDAMSCEA